MPDFDSIIARPRKNSTIEINYMHLSNARCGNISPFEIFQYGGRSKRQ